MSKCTTIDELRNGGWHTSNSRIVTCGPRDLTIEVIDAFMKSGILLLIEQSEFDPTSDGRRVFLNDTSYVCRTELVAADRKRGELDSALNQMGATYRTIGL